MSPRFLQCRAWLLALALGGCATAGQAVGPHAEAPVDLQLRTAGGRALYLHELRGKPLLLFVFTTFDELSQLALTPLNALARRRDEVNVVGIAVQPDPAELLPLYRSSLDIPFALTFEPDNRVVAGETALGKIATVPTFVMLDREGRVVARHVGVASEPQLDAMVDRAR